MPAPKRVIIDTDPGIDDAAAIFLGLGSGELAVEAMTTVYGNVELEQCTRNALTILEAAGHEDIPVYRGASRPLVREPTYAKMIHGDNGLGDIEVAWSQRTPDAGRAVDAIISDVMDAPGEITLVALGPLTNVALAMAAEPRLAGSLQELVVMGGAVLTWGNVTAAASANMFNDPEAARAVYRSGAPIVQVGLDVCRPTVITYEHLDRIKSAGTAPSRLLVDASVFIGDAYRRLRGELHDARGVHFNDVCAMAYTLRPELFTTRDLYVDIEVHGSLTAGATVADFDGRFGEPNVRVCLEVDAKGVADLLADTLAGWRIA